MGSATPKALLAFGAGTVLSRSVEHASACASVSGVVVVSPAGWEDTVRGLVEPYRVDAVVTGADTRQTSVLAGLAVVPSNAEAVVCHDAARPLASTGLFARTIEALDGWDGVVPVLPVSETIKRLQGNVVEATEARNALALAQTPQAFVTDALRRAHERAAADGFEGTDDASLLERAGFKVRTIPGERTNLKLTTADDVRIAEAIQGWAPDQRVGLGFDVHRFAQGRELWLGGVRLEGEDGLEGHSDGDVVCHALADALLGAAGLGDVGRHFPDDDPKTEGIAGLDLLARVVRMVADAGSEPASADLTVIAERPHLQPVSAAIRERLAAVLGLGAERVSVKATRPEGLGLSGDGLGCIAIVVLRHP